MQCKRVLESAPREGNDHEYAHDDPIHLCSGCGRHLCHHRLRQRLERQTCCSPAPTLGRRRLHETPHGLLSSLTALRAYFESLRIRPARFGFAPRAVGGKGLRGGRLSGKRRNAGAPRSRRSSRSFNSPAREYRLARLEHAPITPTDDFVQPLNGSPTESAPLSCAPGVIMQKFSRRRCASQTTTASITISFGRRFRGSPFLARYARSI